MYLPGVLVVSTVWGLTLGAAAGVLSIAAFDFFHIQPALQFVRAVSSGAGGIRDLPARHAATRLGRGVGSAAGERDRQPARGGRLATQMACLLLRSNDLHSARLAQTLGRPTTTIELGKVLVPAGLPEGTEGRVRERVVASVHALRAARSRGDGERR
jgi:hypothetical protein